MYSLNETRQHGALITVIALISPLIIRKEISPRINTEKHDGSVSSFAFNPRFTDKVLFQRENPFNFVNHFALPMKIHSTRVFGITYLDPKKYRKKLEEE